MQMKEMLDLLGITKENLRYYEKMGLVSSSRKENGYRVFNEQDVEQLKKVLLLRRLSVPISEIQAILNGTKELSEVLNDHLGRLDEEIVTLKEARKLSAEIISTKTAFQELNADAYLHKIDQQPAGFLDITKDVLNHSSELFVDSFGHFQFFFPIFKPLLWKRRSKGSPYIAALICMLLILVGGSVSQSASFRNNMTEGHYYLRGMCTYAGIILIWILLRDIVYYLSQKFRKQEKAITVIGSILSAAVSFGLVFTANMYWSHTWMPHPYRGTAVFRNEDAFSVVINRDDEMPGTENDFTLSRQSTYYSASDAEYIRDLKESILNCRPTGSWSVVRNDRDLKRVKQLMGKTEPFYQILWNSKNEITFFYLYEDENMGWLLDEPNYGVYYANDELLKLVHDYSEYVTLNREMMEKFRNIFEYDPQKIWPDPLYKDGRFDTYRYLILEDRQTGEDVTETFIETWRGAYQREEWEVLLDALDTVREIWKYEFVNPEKAPHTGS